MFVVPPISAEQFSRKKYITLSENFTPPYLNGEGKDLSRKTFDIFQSGGVNFSVVQCLIGPS